MRAVLEMVGGLLIVTGIALFSLPIALIVAGVLVILFSMAVR